MTETSPHSAISADTVFRFREEADYVEASYAGGIIVRGRFVGRRTKSDELSLAYAQLHNDGELKTGTSRLRVEHDGQALRLVESYQWSDGATGENVLVSI